MAGSRCLATQPQIPEPSSIGVPEIWTVDPTLHTITIYLLENGDWRATQLPHDGVTNPIRFPSVTIDFSAIWP